MDCLSIGWLLVLCMTYFQFTSSLSVPPALLLTPYIKENKTEEARSLSAVNSSLFLNIPSHSGYLEVDQYNSSTFFWYFPVAGKPVNETPCIVWLQGNPVGASSLTGLFNEVGPFVYDGTLKRRQFAWSDNHSMLFIDNPIGAGFSFINNDKAYDNIWNQYSSQLLSALQQFLTIFPELRKAPLYLAGESYAGRYVPGLATVIMQANLSDEWAINLQGLILGNPVFNRDDIANLTAIFYNWGLVDSQGVLAVKPIQDKYSKAIKDGNTSLAYDYYDELLLKLQDISSQSQTYNVLADSYPPSDFTEYLARDDVKAALHVGDRNFAIMHQTVRNKLIPDFLSDADSEIAKLLNHYKVLVYCGQLDLITPCVPNSEARRQKWQWKQKDMFLNAPRVPWWHNETVAGYVKSGGGFTEALVRGAGSLVAIEKPAQLLDLVFSFIGDKEVKIPPKYEVKLENTPRLAQPSKEEAKAKADPSIGIPENNVVTDKPNVTNITQLNQTVSNLTDATTKASVEIHTTTLSPSLSALPLEQIAQGPNAGLIASVVFNVILILVVAVGGLLYYRLKRRSQDFFYNNVDNNSDDLFLT